MLGWAVGREMQQPDPAVLGMLPSLDQAARLKLVENAHQADRLDFENVGQRRLMDALVLGEVHEHLPLRPCEAEPARTLLEALAHQACDIMDEKADAHGRRGHQSCCS